VLVENIIKEDDEGDEEAPVPQEGEDSPTDDEREEKEEKEKEEKDSEADEGESGEVQEEEVDPPEQMSDAEVMKAVKSISDIVNGTEIENDEEEY